MSSKDFTFLVAMAAKEGLPSARTEAVAASAGAYVGACLGGKAKPHDLLPQTTEKKVLPWKEGKEFLKAWVNGLRKAKEREAAQKASKRITKNAKGVNGNKSSNWFNGADARCSAANRRLAEGRKED
jgi:hypothetical protein